MKQRQISFYYEGKDAETGEVFDTCKDAPFNIILNRGAVFPKMEKALAEMEIGEERVIELAPEDAYRAHDESLIHHVPKCTIPDHELLEIGEYYYWTDPVTAEHVNAKVIAKDEHFVTVDMNHPQAGKALIYWVKVADIKDL